MKPRIQENWTKRTQTGELWDKLKESNNNVCVIGILMGGDLKKYLKIF